MLYRYRLPNDRLDQILLQGYLQHHAAPAVRRTHLFNGRYENIYLTSNEIPELERLVSQISEKAIEILGTDRLRYGLWFNAMPPGAVTTRHNHDNEDELLSCVYYVTVPNDSGDFILYEDDEQIRITPRAGDLLFFPPDSDHEVSVNNSDDNRLSIAINFGPAEQDTDDD